ncbi:MAG TPA: hypothetical protein VD927_05145 [Chryseosolibacter sp.]|nr:hypothetical protein [Chryseosolibacter sp.]
MSKDLAPRRFYNYVVLTVVVGLVATSIAHQTAMDIVMKSDDFVPFILTTSIWGFFVISLMLVFNKCRYVTSIHAADKKSKIGNLLSNSEVDFRNLAIIGKSFGPFYKINANGKSYFIISSDKIIETYKQALGLTDRHYP